MSDRCYMEVSCRRQDAARFEALGFRILDEDKRSGLVRMHDEQANYGHYGEMPEDIPYVGWHGSGGEYGPHRLACDGRKLAEVEASQDGVPVVRVSAGGKVDKRHLKQVMAYRACLKRAKKALGMKDG